MKIALAAAAALLAAGCATPTEYAATPAYSKYTLEEVIQWSREGQSPERIIGKLQQATAYFPLTASEFIKLHEAGVSLAVLDYLQEVYVHQIRYEERFQLPSRFGSRY